MPKSHTTFFIVTPCFNGMPWLPGCIASVAAQAGPDIRVHHHVQDGGSTDGTCEYLAEYLANSQQQLAHGYTFSCESARDEGMYDAINRGWDRADKDVDWLGHLNSDEQYQPGALKKVAIEGRSHPRWGAITGNCIVVDELGEYICSRKPSLGWKWIGRMGIPASTCATFFRRDYYGPDRVRFDTRWKSYGDKVFCTDLLDSGCIFGWIDKYLALFIYRGDENLGYQPITEVERQRYWNEVLRPIERVFSKVIIFLVAFTRRLRFVFGKSLCEYTWLDRSGKSKRIPVYQEVTTGEKK